MTGAPPPGWGPPQPQQPAWGQPQQPQQPAWGQPQQPQQPQQPAWGPPQQPGWGPAPPQRPPYEFNADENAVFAALARWARTLSIAMFAAVVISVLQSFAIFSVGGVGGIGMAVQVAIAISLWGAHVALRAVVQTAGNDIPHLLVAADKLSTVFLLRALIGALLLMALVFVGALVILPLLLFGDQLPLP